MEMILKNVLNAEDVRDLTERLLSEHLSLEVEGYKITTSMVLNVLLKAAIEKRSIEAVCADLADWTLNKSRNLTKRETVPKYRHGTIQYIETVSRRSIPKYQEKHRWGDECAGCVKQPHECEVGSRTQYGAGL